MIRPISEDTKETLWGLLGVASLIAMVVGGQFSLMCGSQLLDPKGIQFVSICAPK